MVIRNVTLEDAEKIQKIYAPYVAETIISFELEVPTVEKIKDSIAERIKKGYPYIVIEGENKKILGYAYSSEFGVREAYKYSAVLSIFLDMSLQSKGLGQKLYAEIEKKLKEKGIVNIVSIIVSENEKSINFHKKNGFEEIGKFEKSGYKFDKWLDIIWMKKQINEYSVVNKK